MKPRAGLRTLSNSLHKITYKCSQDKGGKTSNSENNTTDLHLGLLTQRRATTDANMVSSRSTIFCYIKPKLNRNLDTFQVHQSRENQNSHYFHSFRKDIFFSVSFFITLATAISKSSCVT